MQFEVPQFIEIEDKIFGPLTWQQFLYVGGGGLMAFVLFISLPFFVFIFLGVPLALLALALAFYPVNNRPFSHFLEAIWRFFSRSREYHWQRKQEMVYKESSFMSGTVQNPTLSSTLVGKKDIASIARKLELDAMQKK